MPHEPDDRPEARTPLPPEDRLWRHPSEIAWGPAPADPVLVRRRFRGRALVAVAVISGLTGAAATLVSLAATGALAPRTVERGEEGGAPTTAVAVTSVGIARSAATAVAPAVVEVTVTVGAASHRGSGVVLRSDGLILTSSQLVAAAGRVVVTWPSGRTKAATVAGHDPLTGLAALTVPGTGYPTATVDLTAPEPGEAAITVAGGTGPVLTHAVVSTTGAHVRPDQGQLLGLIETNQPVPDGADGGALIDADGHLRGVSIQGPSSASAGWAVPVEVAQRVADDLRRIGRVDRGWLGVTGSTSDPAAAAPDGLTVDEVVAGSPADRAGLRAGDLLIAVDQDRVRTLADVKAALTMTRPGQVVRVERTRDGATETVTVTLGSTPT